MSPLAAVRRHPHLVALAVVVLIGLWLRAPRIGAGMPYFYHPDEANHFYRTVRMLQTNDYHPYYFLKPTLCFYIRMPAIAGGFLWSAREGEIRRLDEIVRRDENDPTGILWTASHPAHRHVGAVGRHVIQPRDDPGDVRHNPACRGVAVAGGARGAAGGVCPVPDSRVVDNCRRHPDAAFCLLCVWLSLRVMEERRPGARRSPAWRRDWQ